MFTYQKSLQYPVKIATPNPRLASVIISQYGGPDGELGASMRYLSQRYAMPYPEISALLTDIGTVGGAMAPELVSRAGPNEHPAVCPRRQTERWPAPKRGHACPHTPHTFHFLTSPPPHDRLPHIIWHMAPRRQRGL